MNVLFSTIIQSYFNKHFFSLTLFLLLISFSAPSRAVVISSIKPIGFIVEAIGNNVVGSDVLVANGASPHLYCLKPSDIQKIKQADLIIWVGPDLETFLPNVLKGVNDTNQLALVDIPAIHALLYRSSHQVATDHNKLNDHHHDLDYHIWLSPVIATEIAIAVHDRLVKLYPESKPQLDKNLTDFENKLSDTEQIIAKKLANIQNRGYFVFHDAYGYFERHFGLNNLGNFTLNPDIQPGAQKAYRIRRQLTADNAICVFKEPQFSPTIINKVIAGLPIRTGILDPLGSDILLDKNAYFKFLTNLTHQFELCLRRDNR